MFWIGLFLGLFIGGILGIIVVGLCQSAAISDLRMDEAIRKLKE